MIGSEFVAELIELERFHLDFSFIGFLSHNLRQLRQSVRGPTFARV